MDVDPQLISLGIKLGDVAVRNTASSVASRIGAAKTRRKDQETIAELEDIIASLISDKNDLVQISQAYEQELASRRISEADVEYMTTHFVPIVRQLAADGESGSPQSEQAVETIAALLSVETINILQLLGFNFRQAIGEPLTQLIAQLICARMPGNDARSAELQALVMKREIAYIDLARDPEAYARLKAMGETG